METYFCYMDMLAAVDSISIASIFQQCTDKQRRNLYHYLKLDVIVSKIVQRYVYIKNKSIRNLLPIYYDTYIKAAMRLVIAEAVSGVMTLAATGARGPLSGRSGPRLQPLLSGPNTRWA